MKPLILKEIIEFSKTIGRLKKTERTGWVTWINHENPESVADHVFRASVLGMLISDSKKMNTEKIVRMILLHDLAEAIMGDWDYFAKKKLGKEKFKQREEEAIEKILSLLPKELNKKYFKLWHEFLENSSKEAKLARQIDKIEMMLQVLEYEKEGYDKERLKGFWEHHEKDFTDKDLKKIFELIKKERS